METIQDFRIKCHQKLDPLDLDLLLAHVLKKSREFVLTHPERPLSPNQALRVKKLIRRRLHNEPLAYILGSKEFFGLEFKVGGATLIPRPETELIVEMAVEQILQPTTHNLQPATKDIAIIDIGTGSGNIIISIAKTLIGSGLQVPGYRFFGIDISLQALAIAKKNAKLHKLDSKIKFIRGNLLEPVLEKNKFILHNSKFIILANLPYLDQNWKKLLRNKESAGLRFEPVSALYGGPDGLDLYRELAEQIKIFKKQLPKSSITIYCEILHSQKRALEKIFSFAQTVETKKDLAGKWRITKISI